MGTTLQELVDQLTALLEDGVDGDTPMRTLHQPNYPLQFELGGVGFLPSVRKRETYKKAAMEARGITEGAEEEEGSDEFDQEMPYASEVKFVYLLDGNHPDTDPYGPSFGLMQDEVDTYDLDA